MSADGSDVPDPESDQDPTTPEQADSGAVAPLDRPPGRATAAQIENSAREMLAGATIDDLTEFLTVRRLAERSGLSSGAIYSSFAPETGSGARSRTAPQVAARRALLSLDADNDVLMDMQMAVVDDVLSAGLSGVELLHEVAQMLTLPVAAVVRGDLGDGWSYTQLFLMAAVALNDDAVANHLAESYDGYDRAYEPAIEALLAATGRVLVDGVDMRQFARLLVTAADGCALRLRIERELDPHLLTQTFLALWVAMTRRSDERDAQIGQLLAVHGRHPLDEVEVESVRAAVRRVSERAGWPAVTVAKIAQITGISDVQLAGTYPTRHELAGLLWSDLVDGIERRSDARSKLGYEERVIALIDDMCDTACSNRALMASLLIAQLNAASNLDQNYQDPGVKRLVDLIAATVLSAAQELGIDLSPAAMPPGAGDDFRVMARATLDMVLLQASSSEVTAGDLTALIFDGMVGSGVVVGDPTNRS